MGVALGQDSGIIRGLSKAAYSLLDVPVAKFGASVEAKRRAEGVFPPKEIYTPTPDDSQASFSGIYGRRATPDANRPASSR
ncbi:MAG: hypothetical protein WDM76_14320 [Limisphaerales bacterium]